MFPKKWYNGEERKSDGFMVDGYSQMVGGARMRLLRVKRGLFACLFICLFYMSAIFHFLLQGSSAGITAPAGCTSGLQAFRQLSVAFRLYLLSLLERERHCGGTLSWLMTYYHNLASVGAQTSGSGIQRAYQRFTC